MAVAAEVVVVVVAAEVAVEVAGVAVGVVWREVPRSSLSPIVTRASLWHAERRMLL